ncbi:MAG: agmatine deiminase family protein [Luteimonas sp.]
MSHASLRFPAEWEPQSAVLIAWPHASTDWAERLAEVEETYIVLVAAITRFQPALICVPDEDVEAYARARLSSARIDMARVRFVEVPYDDTWLRDTGPITLKSGIGHPAATRTPPVRRMSEPEAADTASAESAPAHPCAAENHPSRFRLLDFRFTGWGGKFEAREDDALVARLDATGLFRKSSLQSIDFALEGGAIETDGAGTLMSTWRCLHERHPGLNREAMATKLRGWLAQDRILWLDHGYLEGDDTDAHIDTLARFAAPDAIVYQSCEDPGDAHYAELQAMARELAALRTVGGEPYRLFPLPLAPPVIDENRRLAASYANFLILNGAVLMPTYGSDQASRQVDVAAAAVLEKAFPGREIVAVPCRPLIGQNGSLHCLTMQLPEGLV